MVKPKINRTVSAKGLPPGTLRRTCDPAGLGFETTDDLTPLKGLVGQKRATDAIRLSAQMRHQDFNLFVLGREGSGRHSIVEQLLSEQLSSRSAPFDWAYVNNFDTPHKPKALCLPSGTAQALKTTMRSMIDDLANEIPALFESEDYQTQRRALEQEFGGRHEAEMAEFADRARAEDVAVLRTPMGYMLTGIVDGKVLKAEDYQQLPPAAQAEIDAKIERLQEDLAKVLRNAPKIEKEHRVQLEQLHAALAEQVVSARVDEAMATFKGIREIETYLEAVRKDIIANAELFLKAAAHENNSPFPEAIKKYHREPEFDRYAINIMVSHGDDADRTPPIIIENLPDLAHLTGRIDHVSEMGTLLTNFTLIKPGALHRANGGYLVMDARRVLTEPFAWDALKRCLKGQEIVITSLADRLSLSSTISLEPDPIPLDLRVVLIGDRFLYMLLVLLDPEFSELFKVQADFDDDMPRTARNAKLFAQLVAGYVRTQNLRALTADGVARLLDEATRMAEDTKKISLRLGALNDLLCEADHYAERAGHARIGAKDIEHAVSEADHRASRLKDLSRDAIKRQLILIDTTGEAVGQINGLSVIDLGNTRFGRPSRITARTRMGSGKLIDIEREVELGGPLHSKGILILSGYLSATYALDLPLSLHASIVFEQSYGGVDGDSASSTELYALLSALSGVPIRQSLAVTGSVNQAGAVQAIGGVNEKIEGFFDVCKARRLTGQQGVLIPRANVDHLMLAPRVVEAVEAGKFHVIPVSGIDEGIELLTGTKAGKRGPGGQFPDGSINARVEKTLTEFATQRRRFGALSAKDQGDRVEGGSL